MTTLCGVDDAPTGDGTLLCLDHATELARELRATAGVVDDLHTTQRRAARFGSGDQGRRSSVTPLSFDERVSPVLAELHYRLSVYSRLEESTPTTKHAADCLDNLDHMRLDDRGAQLYLSLRSVLGRARALVDAPEQRRYAGPCGAEREDEDVCDVDLYVHPSESWVRCPGCNAYWDVEDRRAWMLDAVNDVLACATDIAGLMLDHLGRQVTSSMIRGYDARGRLFPKGVDDQGRKLYRVGDVIDVCTKSKHRHDRSA